MILLCGIPSEPPFAMVEAALRDLRAPVVAFRQREFASCRVSFEVGAEGTAGWLEIGEASYRLEEFRGAYFRLMDDRQLPELKGEPAGSPLRTRCRAVHEALGLWFEVSGGRIVNRPSSMASNGSKPYQAQLIRRHGLEVPETLVTNDPEEAREFRRRHGRVIYKSLSGVRSIVQELDDAALGRLSLIRWCPVQFQEFVEGVNVRVHVVGRAVFATLVRSDAVDYRYAGRQVGTAAELEEYDLPSGTAERCVALAEGLGLAFAGIDLKVRPDGRTVCFEVNPCPGFSYYEGNTGQPIAREVARYLAGEGSVAHQEDDDHDEQDRHQAHRDDNRVAAAELLDLG